MKFLIFIAPNNFKDETLSMLKLFFDKWNIQYDITSYSTKDCIGNHGAACKPDINTNRVSPSGYDGLIIVDGEGIDEYKLFEYRPFLDIVIMFNNSGKKIAAVDNAIKILARANVIQNKKIASPSDPETKRQVQLFHGVLSDKNIEISNNIITIRDNQGLEDPIQTMLQHFGTI